MFAVNRHPNRTELRKFGLTILVGLAVFGGLLWVLGGLQAGQEGPAGARIAAVVLWIVGFVVGLVSLTAPGPARYVYVGWMTTAMAIGMVVTPIMFTVLFFVLLPIFSLIRIKDPLRKKKSSAPTFWDDPVPHPPTLERMMRPF